MTTQTTVPIEDWILISRSGAGRFTASFPGNSAPQSLPRYLQIAPTGSTRRLHLRTSTRKGASGSELWVWPNQLLTTAEKSVPATGITGSNLARYLLFRTTHDPRYLLLIGALVLAIAGVGIDAALGVGKVHAYWVVSDNAIVALVALASILKATGFIVAFIQALGREN